MDNRDQSETVTREAQAINKLLTQKLNASQTTSDEEFNALLHAVTVPMMTLTAKMSGESDSFVHSVCDEVLRQLTGKAPVRDTETGEVDNTTPRPGRRPGMSMDADTLFGEAIHTDEDMMKAAEFARSALSAAISKLADTRWGRPIIRARAMVMVIVGLLDYINMEATYPMEHYDTIRSAMTNMERNLRW